ncbi:MAG: GntR family transcriptional regulator [Spirochaetaceae bacterium]|jgi:GntR family transcriptional regulator|nr:GntR family transcriptional regulator [Spirochaetaceae bacterium]
MINKSPLYQQLNNALLKMIDGEKFHTGDKFLTERAICDLFEVSRATANKALSSLVSAGILEFKKGIGTFIKSIPINNGKATSIFNFIKIAEQAGKTPTWKIKSFDLIYGREAEIEIVSLLKIDIDEQIYQIKRILYADYKPMILEYQYIVAKHYPDLKIDDLSKVFDQRISSSKEIIQAINLNKNEAEIFEEMPGKATLVVTSLWLIEKNSPIGLQRDLYKPDGFEIISTLESNQINQKFLGRIIS